MPGARPALIVPPAPGRVRRIDERAIARYREAVEPPPCIPSRIPPRSSRTVPRGFCIDPEPRYLEILRRINRLQSYHGLKHHPRLLGLFERMLGAPVFPHPRVLMRNILPTQPDYTTKAHQDYPNVQGTTEVYTAWMPLIDCPPELGGLQVACGSHTLGVGTAVRARGS